VRYALPPALTQLPQGSWIFVPKVKTFADYEDEAELDTDINFFMASVIPVVDVQWLIADIQYQATRKSNNKVRHSALVRYYEITRE